MREARRSLLIASDIAISKTRKRNLLISLRLAGGAKERRLLRSWSRVRPDPLFFWDEQGNSPARAAGTKRAAGAAGAAAALRLIPQRRRRRHSDDLLPRGRRRGAVRQPPFRRRCFSYPCGCNRVERKGHRGREGRARGARGRRLEAKLDAFFFFASPDPKLSRERSESLPPPPRPLWPTEG